MRTLIDNPNLVYALSDDIPNVGNIREAIFLTWLKVSHKITASSISDFKEIVPLWAFWLLN